MNKQLQDQGDQSCISTLSPSERLHLTMDAASLFGWSLDIQTTISALVIRDSPSPSSFIVELIQALQWRWKRLQKQKDTNSHASHDTLALYVADIALTLIPFLKHYCNSQSLCLEIEREDDGVRFIETWARFYPFLSDCSVGDGAMLAKLGVLKMIEFLLDTLYIQPLLNQSHNNCVDLINVLNMLTTICNMDTNGTPLVDATLMIDLVLLTNFRNMLLSVLDHVDPSSRVQIETVLTVKEAYLERFLGLHLNTNPRFCWILGSTAPPKAQVHQFDCLELFNSNFRQ